VLLELKLSKCLLLLRKWHQELVESRQFKSTVAKHWTIAIIIVFLSVEYVPQPILSFNHYAFLFQVYHSEMLCYNSDVTKKVL